MQVSKVLQVPRVPKVFLEQQVSLVLKVQLAHREIKVSEVHKVLQVPLDNVAVLGRPVCKVKLAQLVSQDQLVYLETLDYKDLLVILDQQEA
jgi:hypothetical protein